MASSEVFVKRYSNTPTGRLELSASVGIKGLQPVILASKGISLSFKSIKAKGKRVWKTASSKRGRPYVLSPLPRPLWSGPNSFQVGTWPSNTFAPFCTSFTQIAAKVYGSFITSGWFLSETWEMAPVPSRQNIPAPIPPIGNAILSRYACPYLSLNSLSPLLWA